MSVRQREEEDPSQSKRRRLTRTLTTPTLTLEESREGVQMVVCSGFRTDDTDVYRCWKPTELVEGDCVIVEETVTINGQPAFVKFALPDGTSHLASLDHLSNFKKQDAQGQKCQAMAAIFVEALREGKMTGTQQRMLQKSFQALKGTAAHAKPTDSFLKEVAREVNVLLSYGAVLSRAIGPRRKASCQQRLDTSTLWTTNICAYELAHFVTRVAGAGSGMAGTRELKLLLFADDVDDDGDWTSYILLDWWCPSVLLLSSRLRSFHVGFFFVCALALLATQFLPLVALGMKLRFVICYSTDIPQLSALVEALTNVLDYFTDWTPDHWLVGCPATHHVLSSALLKWLHGPSSFVWGLMSESCRVVRGRTRRAEVPQGYYGVIIALFDAEISHKAAAFCQEDWVPQFSDTVSLEAIMLFIILAYLETSRRGCSRVLLLYFCGMLLVPFFVKHFMDEYATLVMGIIELLFSIPLWQCVSYFSDFIDKSAKPILMLRSLQMEAAEKDGLSGAKLRAKVKKLLSQPLAHDVRNVSAAVRARTKRLVYDYDLKKELCSYAAQVQESPGNFINLHGNHHTIACRIAVAEQSRGLQSFFITALPF